MATIEIGWKHQGPINSSNILKIHHVENQENSPNRKRPQWPS
jgi:hypothetical protein